MSRLDDVLREAESLEPDDRFRLIARLWESLPPEHWAAPTPFLIAELRRRSAEPGSDPDQVSAWEACRLVKPATVAEPPKIYSATRRFDLATVFVAMAVYSIFLAWMNLLQFNPAIQVYLGIFVAVVGVGQALLERYVDARRASIWVGTGFHTLSSFILWLTFVDRAPFGMFIGLVLISGVIGGAALGYMAGVLVGGIYLIADVLRGRFGRTTDDAAPATTSEGEQSIPVHPLDSVPSPTP